jgi:hypothetical protein
MILITKFANDYFFFIIKWENIQVSSNVFFSFHTPFTFLTKNDVKSLFPKKKKICSAMQVHYRKKNLCYCFTDIYSYLNSFLYFFFPLFFVRFFLFQIIMNRINNFETSGSSKAKKKKSAEKNDVPVTDHTDKRRRINETETDEAIDGIYLMLYYVFLKKK